MCRHNQLHKKINNTNISHDHKIDSNKPKSDICHPRGENDTPLTKDDKNPEDDKHPDTPLTEDDDNFMSGC